jgi:hypothetical protein
MLFLCPRDTITNCSVIENMRCPIVNIVGFRICRRNGVQSQIDDKTEDENMLASIV